jgi:hypothetical protein
MLPHIPMGKKGSKNRLTGFISTRGHSKIGFQRKQLLKEH